MKKVLLLVPVLAASWSGFYSTHALQDSSQSTESKMIPVSSAGDLDLLALGQSLRSNDLGERRQAYGSLLKRSMESSSALEALQNWTRGDDIELAWSAELLLREHELRSAGRRQGLGLGATRLHSLFPFGEDLESLLQNPFGGLGMAPLNNQDGWLSGPGIQSSRSEGFRLESGPDGVHVEWEETLDGDQIQHVYDADSMEALLEEHPELSDKLTNQWSFNRNSMGAMSLPFGNFQARLGFPQAPFAGLDASGSSQPRMDFLGVQVSTPEERSESIAGVEDNQGLRIEHVIPGSMAQRLRLLTGTTILSFDELTIHSVDDIHAALQARQPGDEVRIEVCDSAGERSWHEWQPEGFSEETESLDEVELH